MDEIENMDHLWKCPAFKKERFQLREIMRRKLIEWNLPFASKVVLSRQAKYTQKLVEIAKRELPLVPSEVILRFCNGFLESNALKPVISLSSFTPLLRQAIPNCSCPLFHVCSRENLFALTTELNQILIKELALTLEANTSSLGHSNLFNKWCSSNPADINFGSIGSLWETDLAGKNSLIVCNYDEKSKFSFIEFRNRIDDFIKSQKPSRILLVCPSPHHSCIPTRTFIPLATIPEGFPLLLSNKISPTLIKSDRPFSVLLVANKESFLYDPIDWYQLKQGLLEWGALNCPSLFIPKETDNLFCERSPMGHAPRAPLEAPSSRHDTYHFFDPEVPPIPETNFLIDAGIPVDIATKISKINNHPRGLSLLGILPNQIRHLLKMSGHDVDIAFEDISLELFWLGYRIWLQRNIQNNHFWKNIAPDDWKLSSTKSVGRPAKHRVELKYIAQKCRNPFHFLKRRQILSSIMPTPCICYKSVSHNSTFVDISFFRIPINTALSLHATVPYNTREDLIRGAHDRSRISAAN